MKDRAKALLAVGLLIAVGGVFYLMRDTILRVEEKIEPQISWHISPHAGYVRGNVVREETRISGSPNEVKQAVAEEMGSTSEEMVNRAFDGMAKAVHVLKEVRTGESPDDANAPVGQDYREGARPLRFVMLEAIDGMRFAAESMRMAAEERAGKEETLAEQTAVVLMKKVAKAADCAADYAERFEERRQRDPLSHRAARKTVALMKIAAGGLDSYVQQNTPENEDMNVAVRDVAQKTARGLRMTAEYIQSLNVWGPRGLKIPVDSDAAESENASDSRDNEDSTDNDDDIFGKKIEKLSAAIEMPNVNTASSSTQPPQSAPVNLGSMFNVVRDPVVENNPVASSLPALIPDEQTQPSNAEIQPVLSPEQQVADTLKAEVKKVESLVVEEIENERVGITSESVEAKPSASETDDHASHGGKKPKVIPLWVPVVNAYRYLTVLSKTQDPSAEKQDSVEAPNPATEAAVLRNEDVEKEVLRVDPKYALDVNILEILSRMVLSDAVSGKEIRIGDMAMGMTLDDVLNAVGLRIERGIDFGMYAGVAFAESYVHDVGITVMSSREERMDCLCDYLIMLVLDKKIRSSSPNDEVISKYINKRNEDPTPIVVAYPGLIWTSNPSIPSGMYAELVLLRFLETARIGVTLD